MQHFTHSIRYSSVSINSSLLSTTLYSLVRTKLIYINIDSSHETISELDSTYNRNPSVKHTHKTVTTMKLTQLNLSTKQMNTTK